MFQGNLHTQAQEEEMSVLVNGKKKVINSNTRLKV